MNNSTKKMLFINRFKIDITIEFEAKIYNKIIIDLDKL